MLAPYTIFGETRLVPVKIYKDCKITDDTEWDEELWVERGEDWYALSCREYDSKRIRVVEREAWMNSKPAARAQDAGREEP